jgi:probable phosphoglycerate mutase
MTRIALMRHFPTEWNDLHKLQGQTDIPLTDTARQTLHGLAIPPAWDAARIIASPLKRADETARILARGRPVALDPRLVEIAYGAWEGRRGIDLLADPNSGYVHVEDAGWHLRPPGGESPWEVWGRVRPALAEIAADPAPALLIVHRALMRVVLARAWGWDYDCPEPFRIKRGRIYPMTLAPDGAPSAPADPVRLVAYP